MLKTTEDQSESVSPLKTNIKVNLLFSIAKRPYEIHLVSFEPETDFEAFLLDDERKKFLDLTEQSIKVSLLIKGETL